MTIDTSRIQSELQEYTGSILLKVKLCKTQSFPTAVHYRDNRITVALNPSKIRCEKTLQALVDELRLDLLGETTNNRESY